MNRYQYYKTKIEKVKFDKKALKITSPSIWLDIYWKEKVFISNIISIEIKINSNVNIRFKFGDIINIFIDCYQIIDDYGFFIILK